MTSENIKNELIKLVSELFQDKGIDPDLIEYVDLIDDLGMESIIFISMILEIEKRFEIIIPDEICVMENFNSMHNIVWLLSNIIKNEGDRE